MKFAYLNAPFAVEIRDVPLGPVGEDDVLLRVKACGVCGSDINNGYNRTEFKPFGHEISGIVEQVGSHVTNVKVGDRVAVESSSFCGDCAACRNGHVELCTNKSLFAPQYNGFAEAIVAKAHTLVKFDGLSFEEAAVLEPFGVAMDLAMVTDVQLGDHVVVMGAGPIGILAVRLAKLRGAAKVKVCAHSHSLRRIQLARQYGADEIIETDKITVQDALQGTPVQRIMVTTPPQTIADAVDIASFGAIICAIGIAKDEQSSLCALNINRMHFKRLQLRFSHATPALFFPQCNELIKAGLVDVKSLISHTFPLDRMQEAMRLCRDDKANVVKVLMVNP